MEKKKTKRQKLNTKYTLPNQDVSVERQLTVLRALVTATGDGQASASEKEVAIKGTAAGMTLADVQKSFAFLSSLALIEGTRQAMTPADDVVKWAKKHEWKPEEAKTILAPFFLKAWFGQAVADAFKLRKKITLDDLIKTLGQTAEAQPADLARPKLRLLVGFLEHFDYIQKGEGETYTLAEARSAEEQGGPEEPPPPPPPPPAPGAAKVSITLNVQLDPSVTEQQAKDLAKAIQTILDTLSKK